MKFLLFLKNFNYHFKSFLITRKTKEVKLLVLDVDGVLTDGKLFINNDGMIFKSFDVKDGLGIKILQKIGIKIALITGANHQATLHRAIHLGIDECHLGIKDKEKCLKKIQQKFGFSKYQTAYIGDDLNDVVVKKNVSLFFAPSDASECTKKIADLCLTRKGGHGVVREVSEIILRKYRIWKLLSKQGWLDTNV